MQIKSTVRTILKGVVSHERGKVLSEALTRGHWTHDYPLTLEQLEHFGLPVRVGMPREVYVLMDLYPQPAGRRPSVQYIPTPDHRRQRD